MRLRAPTTLLAVALLAALIAASATSQAASTSSSVVGATVLSVTNIDASGCASGAASKTDFGPVTAGSANVTTIDCTVVFGSSNDTAKLRIEQSDALGLSMWMPSKGVLDNAFDTDGRVTTSGPGFAFDEAEAVAVQTDGKIVTAGVCDMGGATSFDVCLARYTPSGALDPTFDGDGVVTNSTGPGARYDKAWAIALQDDGKIVTAGQCDMGAATGHDFCLARYTPTGALDVTFDTDGRVTTPIATGGGGDTAYAVAVQSDGKIVAAGYCPMGGATGQDACLARYTSTGVLDPTFDTDGIVTTATAPGAGADNVFAMALQADGRIITAGGCSMGGATGSDACLARYTTTGSLDTTFDTDGIVTTATAPGAGWDTTYAVVIQPDGRIITAGGCYMGVATGYDACLARYTTTGTLDTSFDTDGRVTTDTAPGAGGDTASAVTLQADGRIVTAGFCYMSLATSNDACLARYTTTGTLDTSFDTDGRVTTVTAVGSNDDRVNGVAVRNDGRIVTAGYCYMAGATGDDVCLASYDQGGAVSQYAGGTADWTTPATSHFAACLNTVANAAATWTPDAACAATNGTNWNAIPTTASQIASASTGVVNATANLRFGLRTTPNQPAGDYIAPVTFTVVAP